MTNTDTTTTGSDASFASFASMAEVLDGIRARVPSFPEDFEARLDERLSDLLSHSQLQLLVFASQLFVPDLSRDALMNGATGRDLLSWLERAVESTEVRPSAGPRGSYLGASATLRPLTEIDVSGLYLASLDPRNAHRWRFRGATPSPDNFRRALFSDSVLAQFMVVPRINPGQGVGLVSAYSADLNAGHCYIAFQRSAHTETTGNTKGLMIEGIALFIQYLFDHFNPHKIYAELPEYNLGLLDGLTGTLFIEEGRLLGHYEYADRRWDLHILALYRPAWDEIAQLFRAEWAHADQP